jgi:DNA replication protein DnaC
LIVLERAHEQLLNLELKEAAAILESRLEAAAHKQVPYVDFLVDLLGVELAARRERYLLVRTRLARLPFHKRLDAFEFEFQPSVDERQLRELATLNFALEATNVLFLGPPGVGKIHLAVALGLEAIDRGLTVYFSTAERLVQDLEQAHREHRLDRRMKVYTGPKVLIIDEFGYLPLEGIAATLFFQLVSARYERGSIILTSNKSFAAWGEVLGDPVVATAILDRLLHHSHIVNIRGESYRLREKKRAGLFTGPHARLQPETKS